MFDNFSVCLPSGFCFGGVNEHNNVCVFLRAQLGGLFLIFSL